MQISRFSTISVHFKYILRECKYIQDVQTLLDKVIKVVQFKQKSYYRQDIDMSPSGRVSAAGADTFLRRSRAVSTRPPHFKPAKGNFRLNQPICHHSIKQLRNCC